MRAIRLVVLRREKFTTTRSYEAHANWQEHRRCKWKKITNAQGQQRFVDYSRRKQPSLVAPALIQRLMSTLIRSRTSSTVEEWLSKSRALRSFHKLQRISMFSVSRPRRRSFTCSRRKWFHHWWSCIFPGKEQEHSIHESTSHQISFANLFEMFGCDIVFSDVEDTQLIGGYYMQSICNTTALPWNYSCRAR